MEYCDFSNKTVDGTQYLDYLVCHMLKALMVSLDTADSDIYTEAARKYRVWLHHRIDELHILLMKDEGLVEAACENVRISLDVNAGCRAVLASCQHVRDPPQHYRWNWNLLDQPRQQLLR